MERYGVIKTKQKREIVLLKGRPCAWGRCAFCDYIEDNSLDEAEAFRVNKEVLSRVTGCYGALEVINSGSVFELDRATMEEVRSVVRAKGIGRLFFESSWMYRHRLGEIRLFFGGLTDIVFKCGIETFDDRFRNEVLRKNAVFGGPQEVADCFQSVCLLVGVAGQTKDMVEKDMNILAEYFRYGCVNIFGENTTPVKADKALAAWFMERYGRLEGHDGIDVLWGNTDFGVGGTLGRLEGHDGVDVGIDVLRGNTGCVL